MIAAGRPFLPLFLHVFGAMVLVGAMLAVLLLAIAGRRQRSVASLPGAAFWTLLVVALPAWALMRVAAQWIYSSEGWSGSGDPAWLGIGFGIADAGLLVLLVTAGVAFWWKRGGRPLAGGLVGGLSAIYLALLAVAWLAMSGKWS